MIVTIIVLVIIALGGYYYFMNYQTPAPVMQEEVVTETVETQIPEETVRTTITLDEQNESSESGTAVLTEENGKVKVTLNMTGAPADIPQPAHIHSGACPDVGVVVYPLTSVVNGVSETTLDVTIAGLKSQEPLGINVHKSVPEAKVYVSCGDLAL